MHSILQDVRIAVRGYLAKPLFTVVVLAILGLAIGANSAIVSVVNAVLIRPLDYPQASALSGLSVVGIAMQPPAAKTPDIHFAVTPQPLADAMLTLARVTNKDVVYDLGSGDGRIVVLAAQNYGARGVGIEIDHALVEMSRQVAREGEVADRATFVEGDLFTADISKATVVTLWLSTTVNARLESKLKRELRPGTRIVSRQFPIGAWVPDQAVRIGDETLRLWTVPPRPQEHDDQRRVR